jgi:putative oxidoreductase
MDARRQDLTTSIGLLILRVGAGGYMATHGWGKVQMLLAGEAEKMGDPIGIGSWPSLALVALAEFVCALLVVVGLGTRLAAIPPVIAMAVAAFVTHGKDPWTMSGPGPSKEPALMFLVPFLALVFTGAGRFSLDEMIWRRRKQQSPS